MKFSGETWGLAGGGSGRYLDAGYATDRTALMNGLDQLGLVLGHVS